MIDMASQVMQYFFHQQYDFMQERPKNFFES